MKREVKIVRVQTKVWGPGDEYSVVECPTNFEPGTMVRVEITPHPAPLAAPNTALEELLEELPGRGEYQMAAKDGIRELFRKEGKS